MAKKKTHNKKVHVNKYANQKGLGHNSLVKYQSMLEDLCCAKVPLNGIPKQDELISGKIPLREDFNYLKQKYREHIQY
jgi:hypothetical protein